MATKPRANAQTPLYPPPPTEAQILAMRTVDAIDYLKDNLKAYEALGQLVSIEGVRVDGRQVDFSVVDRDHLCWLLMVVNATVREVVSQAATAAQAAAALAYGRPV